MTKIIVTKSGIVSTIEGANQKGTVIEITGDTIDKVYYGSKKEIMKKIKRKKKKVYG